MTTYNPRNADGAHEIVSIIHTIVQAYISKLFHNDYGTVKGTPEDLVILMDGFSSPLEYNDNDFIIADHLNLEVGDRVVLLPIAEGTAKFFVVAKWNPNVVPLNARVGHTMNQDPDDFVGFEVHASEDRSERRGRWYSQSWAEIEAGVAGVTRTLTHILHTHGGTTDESDGHTHTFETITIDNPE